MRMLNSGLRLMLMPLYLCALVVIAGFVYLFDQIQFSLRRAKTVGATDAENYFAEPRLQSGEDLRGWRRAEPKVVFAERRLMPARFNLSILALRKSTAKPATLAPLDGVELEGVTST